MTVVVVTASVFLTTFTIEATRFLNDSESLVSRLTASLFPLCPTGTVLVSDVEGVSYCVDQYEASVAGTCPHPNPQAIFETAENLRAIECKPESIGQKQPWRFVTHEQARALCARAGKELIASAIWYQAALGTPDSSTACALESNLMNTGKMQDCRSGAGAYDMVGNVWEHVLLSGGESITDLPNSGYVAAVNHTGLPTESTSTPQIAFGEDYVWSQTEERPFTLMRGGFYGSQSDGGVYATHGHLESGFGSNAIGFRCMKRTI